MGSRGTPKIPAELRRRVLIEAGHRCAIPTCHAIVCDVHHIVPWKECKRHDYKNLIALCPNCHRQAEQGRIDKKSLHKYKANLRFTIEKYSQFETDILFELSKDKSGQGLPIPNYLRLLVTRILDAGFVQMVELEGTRWADTLSYRGKDYSVALAPRLLVITDKGRKFVESLSIEQIGY